MLELNQLRIGSVVKLKSGGPEMTVSGFLTQEDGETIVPIKFQIALKKKNDDNTNPFVVCEWFDGTTSTRSVFRKEMLNIIS